MSRVFEILFLRHAPKEGDAITQAGAELAYQHGKELGQKETPTFYYASSKNRTLQTARELLRGFSSIGGNIGNTNPFSIPQFAYDYEEKEPLPEAIFKFSLEFAQAQKEKGEPKAFQLYKEGMLSNIPSAADTGQKLFDFMLKLVKRNAQGKDILTRHIMIAHGGTVLDSIFYSLTGKELSEIDQKGELKALEGFKVIIDKEKTHVLFRGERFPATSV
ncbi:MAG: histidine phosphatase family protein [archaeon]